MPTLVKDANAQSIQVLRPNTTAVVSISGTAASTAPTSEVTRIVSTVDCFYSVIGTATTSSVFLPANSVEFIHTYTDDTLSLITATTGTAYVTAMV